MLVRVLACGLHQISFNKQCFTLVGKQNDGKTTFLRFLCPAPLKPFYKENVSFDKDGRLVLCQNLFVNLEELDALNNREVKEIKTMLSTESVKDRLPYTKTPQSMKRCASFFASTNKTTFLSDETGNVRWLIFKINGVKHDGGGANGYVKQVNIDLVWAQAYALLHSDFEFQLTAEDLARSEQNNASFCQTYSELELIQERFTSSSPDELEAEFLSATNIKERLEAAVTTRKLSPTQIGKALIALGFVREQHYCTIKKFTSYGYWVKENKEPLPFE
jgi:predicted P-loop ATPase